MAGMEEKDLDSTSPPSYCNSSPSLLELEGRETVIMVEVVVESWSMVSDHTEPPQGLGKAMVGVNTLVILATDPASF